MDSSKHRGAMGILRQAFTLPYRNTKLMLPVMLLSFLPCSLLLIVNYLSLYPLLTNLLVKLYYLSRIRDPNSPQFNVILLSIKRNAEAFVDTDLIFNVAYFVVSTFSMAMIIHASAITYSGSKQPTLHEFLGKIRDTWKAPLVTRVYFTLLNVGYTVMSFSIAAALMLNASGMVSLIGMGFALGLAAHLVYVYLSMTWRVGVVMSVLEEGCCGLEALGKGGETVKGRRVGGFMVAFVLEVVHGLLTGGYGVGVSLLAGHNHQMETQKATGLLLLNLSLLLRMFSNVVFTVFYFECRKKHGQNGGALGEMVYRMVPATDKVGDEAIP